jgi:hypothetical protein
MVLSRKTFRVFDAAVGSLTRRSEPLLEGNAMAIGSIQLGFS